MITSEHIIVVITTLTLQFSPITQNINYELRRHKINHKHAFSIFITLKHRFLKGGDNVTSVFYIFNKVDFSLTSHFFDIIRLDLTCLDRGIRTHINVFFLCT